MTNSCSEYPAAFRYRHGLASRTQHFLLGPCSRCGCRKGPLACSLPVATAAGIMVEQFSSLDGDEDFVTLTLPLEGPTIEYFAQRLGHLEIVRA